MKKVPPDYHLYLSKDSPIRNEIHELFSESLYGLEYTRFNTDQMNKMISSIQQTELFVNKERQVNYGIIDILLFNYYTTEEFAKVLEFLFSTFRNYIVIHEVAALSWGDQLIEPSKIFAIMDEYEIDEKHTYHILNEMSTTYPKQTLEYLTTEVSSGSLSENMVRKLEKSMLRDRKEGRILAKDVIPKLTRDEVKELFLQRN